MRRIRIIKSIRRLLFRNRLRLVLSVSGIAVGIACEIAAVAVGNGAREAVLSQIESMGTNLITVASGRFTQAFGRKVQTTFVTTLKPGDAKAIYEGCSHVVAVAPVEQGMVSAEHDGVRTGTALLGTTPSFAGVRNYRLAAGRLFDKGEDKLSMRVAVLGQKVVRALFRRKDPVGETFRMNGIPFRVVGTLMPKGMSYDGVNLDDEILIPLNTAMQRVFNLNYIGYIYVEVTKKEDMQAVEREIRNILRERHDLNVLHEKDDFTIQDIYTSVSAANETRASFSSMVAAVAALSLLVGGMGVLAVMLLSIKERRSEIGLRMAVGAKSGDVLFQFMAEALVLSMTGGFIGILLGVGGVWFMKSFAAINVIISAWSVTVAVAESAMIGVLFGSWPARKASLVLPAKTLRE